MFHNLISPITFFLRWLDKRYDRVYEAKESFRRVFYQQLKGLYPIAYSWPKHSLGIEPRLKRVFPALQAAVAEFRPFVPDGDKANFDNAWLNYHTETGREIDETYTHYMNFSGAGLNSFGGVWRRKNI